MKQFVSTAARAAETALEAVGGESATLKGFGSRQTHPLGETYGSNAAYRYGDYVAKFAIVPASENVKELAKKHFPFGDDFSGLRNAIVEFFRSNGAEWEFAVQLCTDREKMPVEDASVEWPEKLSPYVPVARLVAPAQDAYSAARRVYVDERLSFNPWQALAAHRPLGNVMRARRKAYARAAENRWQENGRKGVEPRGIEELPD